LSSEKKCCKRAGSILSFFAIAVWISYYFEIMMSNRAGLSTENISFWNHLWVFLILFIPGIYLAKFKKEKENSD